MEHLQIKMLGYGVDVDAFFARRRNGWHSIFSVVESLTTYNKNGTTSSLMIEVNGKIGKKTKNL